MGGKNGSPASQERAQKAFTECCVALDHLRDAAEKLDHGSPARRQIQAAATLIVNAIDNMPLRPPRLADKG
jgi:hypothetical protein